MSPKNNNFPCENEMKWNDIQALVYNYFEKTVFAGMGLLIISILVLAGWSGVSLAYDSQSICQTPLRCVAEPFILSILGT